ncbi:MAG TPA: hypothetical protein VGE47_13090, partial [Burkholderiaceae bacterium]
MKNVEVGGFAERAETSDTLPFGSQQYREHFRANTIHRFGGRLGGRLYAAANLLLLSGILLAIALAMPHWESSFLYLLPAYFIFINWLEYVLHRYPMHRKTKGFMIVYEHVTIHHNFYADKNF